MITFLLLFLIKNYIKKYGIITKDALGVDDIC